MSYWKNAGLSYLKYINTAANVLQKSLKEPARSAAAKRSGVHFRERIYVGGKQTEKGFFFFFGLIY